MRKTIIGTLALLIAGSVALGAERTAAASHRHHTFGQGDSCSEARSDAMRTAARYCSDLGYGSLTSYQLGGCLGSGFDTVGVDIYFFCSNG